MYPLVNPRLVDISTRKSVFKWFTFPKRAMNIKKVGDEEEPSFVFAKEE